MKGESFMLARWLDAAPDENAPAGASPVFPIYNLRSAICIAMGGTHNVRDRFPS
jgi:hypothetical protein